MYGSTFPANIRLVGGSSANEGRIEVFYDGHWGTVCDDLWDDTDAGVACQAIGLGDIGIAFGSAAFGQGSGPIILDNVQCAGTETDLFFCPNNGPSKHNCAHSEDAGVQCFMAPESAIRLVGGSSGKEGRVEVFYDGQWGTVCDDLWDDTDAGVVCQALGLGDSGISVGSAAFGQGSGPIILDNVQCAGTETDLFSCPNNGPSNHNCAHIEDAGVQCSTAPEFGEVRLVGGLSSAEGRVEISYYGTWGTISDENWDLSEAEVVCRSLGFPGALEAVRSSRFGRGTGPIVLGSVSCRGSESNIRECTHLGGVPSRTSRLMDHRPTGVRCQTDEHIDGFLRLAEGRLPSEGRVEIRHNGIWGTVCINQGWTLNDAKVVCRSLGFPGALEAVPSTRYSSKPAFLREVGCNGNEMHIQRCPYFRLGVYNCDIHAGVRCDFLQAHNLKGSCEQSCCVYSRSPCDAGGCFCDADCSYHGDCCQDYFDVCPNPVSLPIVRPSQEKDGYVRLVGGALPSEGRVEMSYRGQWGTICDNEWTLKNANVICRSLGYRRALVAVRSAGFGPGTGPILLDDVRCLGNESDILDCPHAGLGVHNCDHEEDAGVRCISMKSEGEVRLVGGAFPSEGRVEISYNGIWATVCDDDWNLNDANVVCRSLGFPGALIVFHHTRFGRSPLPNLIHYVGCHGNETNILECSNSASFIHYGCRYGYHAGVRCRTTPADGEYIRLAGGNSPSEGRVEILYNGTWGTICGNHWNSQAANVLCRSLGLPGASEPVLFHGFGRGTGPPVIYSVLCIGSEPNIFSCRHFGDMSSILMCRQGEGAGIRCQMNNRPDGELRLRETPWRQDQGIVEVIYNGTWRTICGDGWDINNAHVACRSLGFPRALKVLSFNQGRYIRPGILDEVRCHGNESNILDCPHAFGIRRCTRRLKAGVQCDSNRRNELYGSCLWSCCVNARSPCYAGRCYCDDACSHYGDCCQDYFEVCPNSRST